MQSQIVDNFFKDLRDLHLLESFKIDSLLQTEVCKQNRSEKLCRRRFNPLIELSDAEFCQYYRFTKDNMQKIIDMIRDDLETDSFESRTNQVPVEQQIMAAIRFWGSIEHPNITSSVHEISPKTLSKICRRVAAAFASKASRYIRMPATLAEKEDVTNAFQKLAGMPQVIGALSYLNVRIKPDNLKAGDKESACDTESHLYIQIVTDASLKIRDVDCKQRMHGEQNPELHMFMQSRIKERFEQNEFRGRVILGDDRLFSFHYMFTPIECPNTMREQAFNRSHSSTLAAVYNCVNLLRTRFGILDSDFRVPYLNARHVIIALALLHNMAIEWSDPSLDVCSFVNEDLPPLRESPVNAQKRSDTNARSEFIKNYF